MEIKPIAKIKTDFPEKFGVPRQSARGSTLFGEVVFNAEYSSPEAVRYLEEYSHIWLIWGFSENEMHPFRPTVRPPMLGGNKRAGVFATRSPFRPNALGLSCVQLIHVNQASQPVTLTVKGIDMVNNTPVYDIKPYIPYTDMVAGATAADFCMAAAQKTCPVIFDKAAKGVLSKEKETQLLEVLGNNPKPAYQTDTERIYAFDFSNYQICFQVSPEKITVLSIKPHENKS